MLEAGAIYSYSFLWAREADAGEESGRKDRPACLLLRPSLHPDLLYMFAITSRAPLPGRAAHLLPAQECKKCGLHEPAWIILDEYNVTLASELHDFASLTPLGSLSPALIKSLAEKVVAAIGSGRARGVRRN
jgi:hypothetical protein